MSQMLKLEGGSLTENVVVDKRYTAQSDLENDISTQSAELVRYSVVGNVNSNQLEFQVEPSASGYIDLKNSYIASQVRILKGGTTPVTGADNSMPKAFTSLLQWSDIKTYINDVEVSDENSGLYAYTAWVKTALEQSNLASANFAEIPGSSSQGPRLIQSSDPRSTEGIVLPDSQKLSGGEQSMISVYMRAKYFSQIGTDGGYYDVKTSPKDAIWQQPDYLPPNCRLRLVLTKNADAQVIEDFNATVTNNTLDYNSCFLFLKKVYPTPSMQTIAKQVQMDRGMLYTLLRARTAQVAFNTSQGTLTANGLLASQNPSLVVVGFYNDFDTASAYKNHAYNSNINFFTSLYIRVGGERIPANFDYERNSATSTAGSLIDYNEYLHACKASSLNNTLSDNDKPLISYEAYRSLSFYVFRCKRNLSTTYGQDDSSNVNGAIDVYARFTPQAVGNQARMIVIGLSHDQVMIDKHGKVTRLGW